MFTALCISLAFNGLLLLILAMIYYGTDPMEEPAPVVTQQRPQLRVQRDYRAVRQLLLREPVIAMMIIRHWIALVTWWRQMPVRSRYPMGGRSAEFHEDTQVWRRARPKG